MCHASCAVWCCATDEGTTDTSRHVKAIDLADQQLCISSRRGGQTERPSNIQGGQGNAVQCIAVCYSPAQPSIAQFSSLRYESSYHLTSTSHHITSHHIKSHHNHITIRSHHNHNHNHNHSHTHSTSPRQYAAKSNLPEVRHSDGPVLCCTRHAAAWVEETEGKRRSTPLTLHHASHHAWPEACLMTQSRMGHFEPCSILHQHTHVCMHANIQTYTQTSTILTHPHIR